MKKIVLMLFTALIAFACDISGKRESDELKNDETRFANVLTYACFSKECFGSIDPPFYRYSDKKITGNIIWNDCKDCHRDYYHKQDYTERTETRICADCGHYKSQTKRVDVICNKDPNEGELFDYRWNHYYCYNERCSRYYSSLKRRSFTTPGEVRKEWVYARDCTDFCRFKYDGGRHRRAYLLRYSDFYCDGTLSTGESCTLDSFVFSEKYYLACYYVD